MSTAEYRIHTAASTPEVTTGYSPGACTLTQRDATYFRLQCTSAVEVGSIALCRWKFVGEVFQGSTQLCLLPWVYDPAVYSAVVTSYLYLSRLITGIS